MYSAQIYWIIRDIGRNEVEVSRMQHAMEKLQARQQSQHLGRCQQSPPCLTSKMEGHKSGVHNERHGNTVVREDIVFADCISFDSFVMIIDEGRNQNDNQTNEVNCDANSSSSHTARKEEPVVKADLTREEKIHFLRILEEYRMKCDAEGNYLHAQQFLKHVRCLQQEEETRQLQIVRTRQLRDKRKIIEAHEYQFLEFNKCE